MSPADTRRFAPRPEARAMTWNGMLSPVRRGVYELLARIDGAVNGPCDADVANCFLVAGDRGTGKTTVLLSAKSAVADITDPRAGERTGFWDRRAECASAAPPRYLREPAYECTSRLAQAKVVWLETLDLQPLPGDANLLTSLLTRVRDALSCDDAKGGDDGVRSLLDDGLDGARSQLGRLIKDATMMWETIDEPDTRNRAQRQVATADIYASFRKRFKHAMQALSLELGRSRGCASNGCSIVLPIDNIDRSSDHINAIVKLAGMVSCRRLWLVLAGGRLDLETFLERAYWKELVQVGSGTVGLAKETPEEEDEALAMARRQAAAALHKALPPSHRIELDTVAPAEALTFRALDHGDVRTIHQLLSEVPLPSHRTCPDGGTFLRLIDLFDLSRLLGDPCAANPPPLVADELPQQISSAARDALRLPVRSVLDLWQVSYWALSDLSQGGAAEEAGLGGPAPAAERIARVMLRNVIAPSTLPSKLTCFLQEKVIVREPNGNTTLDFSQVDGKVGSITAFDRWRQVGPDPAAGNPLATRFLRSRIESSETQRILMWIGAKAAGVREAQLPPLVAGWFAILFDTLMLSPRVAILDPPKNLDKLSSRSLVTKHELLSRGPGGACWQSELPLPWPAPPWRTFLAHDLFARLWARTRDDVKPHVFDGHKPLDAQRLSGLVALWVACALQTVAVLEPQLRLATRRSEACKRLQSGDESPGARDWLQVERDLAVELGEVYERLRSIADGLDPGTPMPEGNLPGWMESSLPLLLSPAYVPLRSPKQARERCARVIAAIEEGARRARTGGDAGAHAAVPDEDGGSALVAYWRTNAAMILAPMEFELKKKLGGAPPQPAGTKGALMALAETLSRLTSVAGGEAHPGPGTTETPTPENDPLADFGVLAQCLGLDVDTAPVT